MMPTPPAAPESTKPASGAPVPGKWRVTAIYALLTLLHAYPLSIAPHRTLPADDPDGHLFMWTLAWDTHAFTHQPLSIFDANIFHPLHNSLAYSENLIGSALFAAPVLWVTGNPVLAVNVVSLLSCVLCGLGAYVLGRRLGMSARAAFITGLIFTFSPPRFLRFSQLHLTVVQWIPFALASLHAYLDGGRRRDLLLALGFTTLQVLSSGHGGVFLVVAVALLLVYRIALGERISIATRLRDVGVAGALILLPNILMMIPYRLAQSEVGLRRGIGGWKMPVESFFASPTRVDVLLQSIFTSRNINEAASAWLFPGVLPLLLAATPVALGAVAVIARRHRQPARASQPLGFARQALVAYRRPLIALMAAAVSWALLGAVRQALPAGTGLLGQYYANTNWTGPVALSPQDEEPSTDQMFGRWNDEPPASFSVAWTGYLTVVRPGLYFFATTSDDRSRMSVDTQIIVDNPGGQRTGRAGSVRLDPGPHRVVLEYVHSAGRPQLKWEWVFDGDADKSYKLIPRWALSRRPVGAAGVITARAVEWLRTAAAFGIGLAALWLALAITQRDAWASAFAARRRNSIPFYLLLALVCVWLALGPPYGLWRFVYWWPGFNFIRASSRFMVLGLLAIAVLAGFGFDSLTARLSAVRQRWAVLIASGLLMAEFSVFPYTGVPYRFEVPAADQWVARQAKPFVVAEVPVTWSERYHSNYMLHSMAHWQPTVHGYSGIRPFLHEVLYDKMKTFPSEDVIQELAKLQVSYLIVHTSWFPQSDRRRLEEQLPKFDSLLDLRYQDAESRVYAIRPQPQAAR